ncbi:M20/M25/M40 family metallo-hydrolase [Muriicola sp.]|uniref:M20/M25/M40 family metallo-hydrolase n=1 Tax=Muriicola sp. TaxID=2020856 RepID=UPI00356B38C9
MKHIVYLLLYCLLAAPTLTGQKLSERRIKSAATEAYPAGLRELMTFLKIPNIGSDPEHVARNLDWCKETFSSMGFRTRVIETATAPLLFAEKLVSPKKKTVMFYLQIDGQPVDASEWEQDDPFIPVIKEKGGDGMWNTVDWDGRSIPHPEWRLFGRSASDSKGPAMAFITAVQYFFEHRYQPEFNIKVVMDFQEELGSPSLPQAVIENRNLFDADMVLIMDGTRHISNWPTLCFGARGIATARIRIFGPYAPLHSGQYGNYAPNPVFEAARLISSMKDERGKVLIQGFYDGISLTEEDKKALGSLPENEDSLRLRLGIHSRDAVGENYQESLQYPSLNIRGLQSGWVGKEVRTIIPDVVDIEIDMRLVPETPGERMMQLLRDHMEREGLYLVDDLPTPEERAEYPKLASLEYRLGSLPFRTAMDSETGRYLNKALSRVFGEKVVHMRTTGGSQPIAPFIKTLDLPAVSIRIPNPDNNIHAPNENLRLGNFLEGIMTCLAILNEPLK